MNWRRFWIGILVLISTFIGAAALAGGIYQFFIVSGRVVELLAALAGALLLVYIWLVLSGKLKS